MKKIIAILLILAYGISVSNAQPNGGFENWLTEFSAYENPENWQTFNFLSILDAQNPVSTFKAISIDKHSGNYAMKLKTVYFPNNPLPGYLGDSMGGAFTGKIDPSPFSYRYGFPYTGRPEKMEFWAKYAAVGNDTAAAFVVLQKWNDSTGVRDTLALGGINILTTANYTLFQVDFIYYSEELPDTAAIIFLPSKNKHVARINSTLFIDDVELTGWVGINEQAFYADKIKIFPNPSSNAVTIHAQIDDATIVQIMDLSGKLIGTYEIQNYYAQVNTVLLADGTYFYTIHDKKKQILSKGKFNVIK